MHSVVYVNTYYMRTYKHTHNMWLQPATKPWARSAASCATPRSVQ